MERRRRRGRDVCGCNKCVGLDVGVSAGITNVHGNEKAAKGKGLF